MADEALEAAAAFPPNPRSGPHKHHRIRDLRSRVLGGSAIMLLSSVFVGGLNLVYNFAVAHELGAGNFGHASVVYTMLMLLSAVTLSFQLVCSKFVARTDSRRSVAFRTSSALCPDRRRSEPFARGVGNSTDDSDIS